MLLYIGCKLCTHYGCDNQDITVQYGVVAYVSSVYVEVMYCISVCFVPITECLSQSVIETSHTRGV